MGFQQCRLRSRLAKSTTIHPGKRQIELLVDADNPGIHAIREAVKRLTEAKNAIVHTTLFAEPRRLENNK